MKWCLCLLLTFTAILMFLSVVISGSGMDPNCDPKYKNFRASHTRCRKPHAGAKLTVLTQAQKDAILEMHNVLRRESDPPAADMMKMVWDDTLAKTVEKLVMTCRVRHDTIKNREEPGMPGVKIGQNLGAGHKTFQIMMDKFHDERALYTYGKRYVKGAGHYFQLVAHETVRVGCAEAICPGSKPFRGCNYAPALNGAKPPYKNGTRCGACPNSCDTTHQKLCDCGGKVCYHSGTLDPANCKCKCRGSWIGEHCETLDCSKPEPTACEKYKPSDCGNPRKFTADPNTCPRLCGVCKNKCGDVQCKNGGELNWDTCKCEACSGQFRGDTCEDCPKTESPLCMARYSKEECEKPSVYLACPIHCGKCKTKCERCPNYGELDTDTCKCTCKPKFSGDRCEKCQKADEAYCGFVSHLCQAESAQQAYQVHIMCPKTCKLCGQAAPSK